MTTTAQELLEEFDHLAEEDKREVASEILKRVPHIEWPAVSDEELVLNAETVFLELDDREQQNGGTEAR